MSMLSNLRKSERGDKGGRNEGRSEGNEGASEGPCIADGEGQRQQLPPFADWLVSSRVRPFAASPLAHEHGDGNIYSVTLLSVTNNN